MTFILILLHKPSESQYLCRGQHLAEDHSYWSFLLPLCWQAVLMEESEYLTFLPKEKQHKLQESNVLLCHPKSGFACRSWWWMNQCITETEVWWQRHSSTYCWTRNMQSKRNSSFVVQSSHSEQALLCLRQLHFYDNNQAFYSVFFMPMCMVLKKLSQ